MKTFSGSKTRVCLASACATLPVLVRSAYGVGQKCNGCLRCAMLVCSPHPPVFEHVPLLRRYAGHVDTIFQKFLDYKFKVPVCGAAILSPGMDKCLLVKGWSSGAGWSFPRGKINQGEDMDKCAIREVRLQQRHSCLLRQER